MSGSLTTARDRLANRDGTWGDLAVTAVLAVVELTDVVRSIGDELYTLREIIDSKGRDG